MAAFLITSTKYCTNNNCLIFNIICSAMVIQLKNIVPNFLEKQKIERSGIWQHEHSFCKGEKIQIIAPSGSGKTSLIHFLYGIRKEFTGEILFDNKSLVSISEDELATMRAAKLSIIFQDLRLFKGFTALENIEIKKQLASYHESSRISSMASQLGIENKLLQDAGTCSFGEQQRIAIIRALQQPFDFIVMDEPFSHLDEANSKMAMQLIETEANERGAGIILADLQPIPFFNADRTLHL
jgi:ABC-type lipoprotein export system ATPase subunit